MPTITELREQAEDLGVDLEGLMLKTDIEAKIAAHSEDQDDDDGPDDAPVTNAEIFLDDDEDDNEPEAEAVDLAPTYKERARLAGFGSGEAQRMLDDGLSESTDFEVPIRRGEIPRQVNDLTYAGLEQSIRGHSEVIPVAIPSTEVVAYRLPDDHGLTGAQLQDLLVEIREASDADEPMPTFEDFKDSITEIEPPDDD